MKGPIEMGPDPVLGNRCLGGLSVQQRTPFDLQCTTCCESVDLLFLANVPHGVVDAGGVQVVNKSGI